MLHPDYRYPEPVPTATQLAVLPFVAAVDGLLRGTHDVPNLRITVHRVMSREGEGYLQQMCGYVGAGGVDFESMGRVFRVSHGIMGAAFSSGLIWRTRYYDDPAKLVLDLSEDMKNVGDTRPLDAVATSYLAIPFLGLEHDGKRDTILILYADCKEFNFFAHDERVRQIVEMGGGFCRLFDSLQRSPFPNLRNFPLHKGTPASAAPTLYPKVQEPLNAPPPPQFSEVPSFNYEAAAA
jgi:hypothetical protein